VGQLTTFPLEITCHLVDLKKTSLVCEVIVFKKFFSGDLTLLLGHLAIENRLGCPVVVHS